VNSSSNSFVRKEHWLDITGEAFIHSCRNFSCSVSAVDASAVVEVQNVDLGFSWKVVDVDIIEDNRFVLSGLKSLEVVHVGDE